MTEKWTHGPWEFLQSLTRVDGEYDFAISASGVPVLGEAFGVGSGGYVLPAKANARLMAAAPDLYEALADGEELIAGDLVGVEWKQACAAFLDKARAALSRARGE